GLLQVQDVFHVSSLTLIGGNVLATNQGLLIPQAIHATSAIVQQGLGLGTQSAHITGNVVAEIPNPVVFDVTNGPGAPDLIFDGPLGANQFGDGSSMTKTGAGDLEFTGPNSYGGT